MTETELTRQIRAIKEPGKPDRAVFILTGPEGAVTFEILGVWDGRPFGGPIEIHYPVTPGSPQVCEPGTVAPNQCEFVPGGLCRADQAFRAGADAGERYRAGREDAVFAEMEYWYTSRLAPARADQ